MKRSTPACLFAVIGLALVLAGCAQVDRSLTRLSNFSNKYAPLIGKDLILVGNIIVQAECSPAIIPVTAQAISILNIVAPSSRAAQTVTGILQKNADITQKLCPLVASIRATVGPVPQNAVPVAVVPDTSAAPVVISAPAI